MKTYNSYQKAQIANPKDPIGIDSTGKFLVISSEIDNHPGTVVKCDPLNYCFTVEEFLNSGHRFVIGDIYWSFGSIYTVGHGEDVKYANISHDNDKDCFVLKAKALGEPSDEKSEWDGSGLPPAGTECECFDFTLDKWFKVKTLDAKTESGEIAVTSINNHKRYAKLFWGCKFRKLGSEEQIQERLRIEAAYELYCIWCGIMGYPKFCIEDFKCTEYDLSAMLSIVDKTGYRVEGDKDGSVPVQANKLPDIDNTHNKEGALNQVRKTMAEAHTLYCCYVNSHEMRFTPLTPQEFINNEKLASTWVHTLQKARKTIKGEE